MQIPALALREMQQLPFALPLPMQKVKVKVLVGYRPPDGGKGTQTRVLRLRER